MDEKNTEMIPNDPQEQPIPEVPEAQEQPTVFAEAPAAQEAAPVYGPEQPLPEYIPEQPQYIPQEAPAAPVPPRKKLNKKLLAFAAIGVVAAVVLVAVLVSLLGREKHYGVYLKDGEVYIYVDGMDAPMEVSSRLWKEADEARDFFGHGTYFGNFVFVRNEGKRIFFPDKCDSDGVTLYYRDVNKPDEDPVKIDSGVTSATVTEDGSTVLYLKGDKDTLYLYNVKEQEETKIDSGVARFYYTDDFSRLCYMTDDGKVFIWTAETDGVKVAKDASSIHYFPETDMLFVLDEDGALLRKTAEMEEAEEIAGNVVRVAKAYASGEVYYIRQSVVERSLIEYLDDDLKVSDAAITQPKKPTYPSAPKKPYYWNYVEYSDYEEALAEYNTLYAEYLEEYNRLKDEYEAAYDRYLEKAEREEVRAELAERVVKYNEYALYFYNGTEEITLTENLTDKYFHDYGTDTAVIVYDVFVPGEIVKPRMSELEPDTWSVPYEITGNIQEALYTEKAVFLAVGADASAIEHTDGSDFKVSDDGAAVYFLDAPFVAYDEDDMPAVTEAPAADVPAEEADGEDEEEENDLISASHRQYASLYRISIADGQAGAPELVDSEVSLYFSIRAGATADQLLYAKDVDEDEHTGEFYANGQRIDDDTNMPFYTYMEDSILFYTDWDEDDSCGTLCMMKLGNGEAEPVEIADDVFDFEITGSGDILYLQDYNLERYEGTLFLYDTARGEAVEMDDDVTFLFPIG